MRLPASEPRDMLWSSASRRGQAVFLFHGPVSPQQYPSSSTPEIAVVEFFLIRLLEKKVEKDNYWLREDAKCQRSHVCPLPPSPSPKPDIFHRHTMPRTFPSRQQPRRSFLIYEMDYGFIFNLLSQCKKHKTFSDFYTNDVCNAG